MLNLQRSSRLLPRIGLLFAVGAASCSDGSGPAGPEPGVQIEISFEVAGPWTGLFDPSAVQTLRVAIVTSGVSEAVETLTTPWDPSAEPWSLAIETDAVERGSPDLIAELELVGVEGVQWSGRSPAFAAPAFDTPAAVSLTLYRGPLANLTLTNLEVADVPPSLDEGTAMRLEARTTGGDPAQARSVRVFWTSNDPDVASVDSLGLVTALSPGPVSILAVAGPAADTVSLEIAAVAVGVLLDPPMARLTSLTEEITLQAAVVDVRGDTLSDRSLIWMSTDSAVVAPVGPGRFRAIGVGAAEAVVQVAGAPEAEGRAPIEVGQEIAAVELSADTVRFGALGDEVSLIVTATDGAGVPVSGAVETLWASSNPSVATVDSAGRVSAVANGSSEITASVETGADTITVSATVDVAQVVSTVTVAPADTVVASGAEPRFVAEAFDANANAVTGVTFMWSSSEPAVASIDATGLSMALSTGVTSIRAEVGGVEAATDLTVLPSGGFTRVWIGGHPAAPSDWSVQDNWLPALVPTVSDTVQIPASAPDRPVLSSDRSVADLVVEDGATVDLAGFTLSLTGDLDAGATILGPGTVRMLGTAASARGSLPSLVVNGTLAASGTLHVAGDLSVRGAGAGLDIGGEAVSVSGVLRVEEGATLTMRDPDGVLDVDGEAVLDGGSTLGLLTAGVLRVGGSFTAWISEPESFAPTGSHRTVLDGTVIQLVYLHHSDPGQARFHDLEIDNPGGVRLTSTVRVTGGLTLARGTLDGLQTVVLDGDLTELGAGSQHRVLNTVFTGSPALPSFMQTNATFSGSHVATNDLEVIGSVTVQGQNATFDVGASRIVVTGDFVTADGGRLIMQDGAGVFDAWGDAFFDGGSTLGLLTAGELSVGGDFTAADGVAQNYAPSGTHRTVLDGTAAQAVYLHHNGVGESRFQHLELDNPAGASLRSTTRVLADVVLTEGTLDGPQTMIVGGDLIEVLGENQYRVLHTTFSGSPALPASVETNATFTGTHLFGGDVEIVGDLLVDGAGAVLEIGAHTVTVRGDLRTANGGVLAMRDASSLLVVEADAEFNGGSTLGQLTDGELRVAGDFTAWISHVENFAPTGSHRTTLNGAAAQSVFLHHSGADEARFEDLAIVGSGGVTLLGTVRVTDALTVTSGLSVGTGGSTLVGGTFTLEAPATLTNEGSVQANGCTLLGTVIGNQPICP